MFLRGGDDGVGRLLDAKIHDLIAVVTQNDVDEILPDVMHIALDGRKHNRPFARALYLLHFGLEISDCVFHDSGRVKHRRQLHLARPEQFTHGLHAV